VSECPEYTHGDCRLRPEDYGLDLCDQGEDDPDICYRFQHTRAEAAEAEVERLKEALRLAEHEALGSDALLNHAVPVIVAARRYIAKGNNGTTEPCGPHCAGCEGHGICGIEQLAVSVMEYDSLFRTAHEAREEEAGGE